MFACLPIFNNRHISLDTFLEKHGNQIDWYFIMQQGLFIARRTLGCPKKTFFWISFWRLNHWCGLVPRAPEKIQRYRPINDRQRTIWNFGLIERVKRPQNGSKNMIFKNWLVTRPKMETHEPNVYPTILGGVSRGFWSPFEDLGARSAIFWHLKMGTFGKSAYFQVPKNGTPSAQI